ncbi:quinohemoprotein amine dehydrogenase subunit alpha [Pontibacterium granulatum]|uniref:quinohemoprotein amine dehydrogenase subunit alpha n=1 Tax=Pontibacterium granulatum TaxID=2036029 RepID=UPI00249A3428|nr:quinohemoprotein amine dehydrogenase subunit alpha [Pontibacterium granulatum]MDI3325873.1 quinohemoprotein amine dehydrogenase subunit alpha [Pontibacterium granulatum]
MNTIIRSPLAFAISAALATTALPASAQEDAVKIVQSKCLACHTEESHTKKNEGAPQWSRISHQRKTPEGWLMTIGRMQMMHGLQISDDERSAVVKYLADRQGLAPEETADYRYAMERRLDTMEAFDDSFFEEMCARCHSGARVGLQRRPAEEWEHLVHFHLGQWPSTEYQALARDRDWFPMAINDMVPKLAKMFPMDSDSWDHWQAAPKPEFVGQWSFAVHQPGRGDGSGLMTVTKQEGDQYSVSVDGQWADGTPLKGSGSAIVYTGFEWRAEIDLGGVITRQVLAASKDGMNLRGRVFEAAHDERGMEFTAAKATTGNSQIIAVYPQNLKAGESTEVTIVGAGLKGRVSMGNGVSIEKVLKRSYNSVTVLTKADADATTSANAVTVGGVNGGQFAVYKKVDSVKVQPAFTIARVGGNGGSTPKVQARFEAEAWGAGPDGQSGTDDDIRIGYLPANWHVEPFDEAAKADNDVHFAGRMDAASGVFTPGNAGPNPERRMSTNNAGNLKVVASVKDGDQTLQGDGQLIVTVQRWNDAPLP